ncbi:hemophore-related protein [[Mycobacterium] wendilense]|uniref:Hemophore-related protein n=1 Tax=[Mycobacterium] wendilense TaxID=3064284 RepID=A0ABM9M933_9MYCO|nr:hemophore-related protein [Mycolicibacterium sp. MU0050]CAJ1579365.1 hemophore-related protein [Mycolicibacterium sp. MU0050]
MVNSLSTKLAVAAAGLGLALTAGAGFASAAPNLDSMVNTTCSYPQVVAAIDAQDSPAAAEFRGSPQSLGMLQQFLGMSPPQRRQMVDLMAGHPANAPYLPLIEQVFNTCNNY